METLDVLGNNVVQPRRYYHTCHYGSCQETQEKLNSLSADRDIQSYWLSMEFVTRNGRRLGHRLGETLVAGCVYNAIDAQRYGYIKELEFANQQHNTITRK